MNRLVSTTVAVFAMAGSVVCSAEARTHFELPAAQSATVSSAFVAPAHEPVVAVTAASEAAADKAAFDAVAAFVPLTSVTSDETQMWGEPIAKKESTLRRFAHSVLSRTTAIAAGLERSALRFIGTPYVFGGTSRSGFDCSGYVQHVFAMLGLRIPRTADAQYYAGQKIRGDMSKGDLVFFQTYAPGPSHVGIYLGHGQFVHASSHGVMVSHLSDSYWRARYIGAKRLVVAKL